MADVGIFEAPLLGGGAMLEHYFLRPDTIERIRASWVGVLIERYVTWLTERGYAARNVYRRVPLLVRFGAFTQARGAISWQELPSHLDDFVSVSVEDWIAKHRDPVSAAAQRKVERFTQGVVLQMLALCNPEDVIRPRRRRAPDPFYAATPGFFPYLKEERGLRASSIVHYHYALRRLEVYLTTLGGVEPGALSPPILSGFITATAPTVERSSMIGICVATRIWLRYLHREGILARDLSRVVEVPQRYRLADVPRSITWDEVRRMLEAVDQRTPVGRRDYAILVLLVTYGLRAREIAALTLDHVDWKRERLLVPERKADHTTAYPLSAVVGDALIRYIRNGRPSTHDRQIFLRHLAPVRPLTHSAVSGRASHYLHRAGIVVKRTGSHTLRHTCVQRLVDAGFPLKTIGDYVGHRSPSSTEIYAKVAVETLREVALGDGEALQ
jgi:integrase/recombinase XerD